MSHAWILDVLTDLEAYAEANDLDALAEGLSAAAAVALIEITADDPGMAHIVRGHDLEPPRLSGTG